MKLYNITYFFVLFSLIASCSKNSEAPIDEPVEEMTEEYPTAPIFDAGTMEHGWVSAKKNGEDFWASAVASKSSNGLDFRIAFETYSEEGYLRESFYFAHLTYEEKSFGLNTDFWNPVPDMVAIVYSTYIDDGDVTGVSYLLNEEKEAENYITITDLDLENNIVKGTFNVHYLKRVEFEGAYPETFPEKVKLTDGQFEISFVN